MGSFFKKICSTILLCGIIANVGAENSGSIDILLAHPFVSQRVKNAIENEQSTSKKTIVAIQSNVNTLEQLLIHEYDSEILRVDNPITEHEQVSQALDLLSTYLCTQRDLLIEQYPTKKILKPSTNSESLVHSVGMCYRDMMLLGQEALRYYTLPGVGTMQTTSLSLMRSLGYSTQHLEEYIRSSELQPASPQGFYLERNNTKRIVPLLDLSSHESLKALHRKFDKVKAIAYLETDNYPFVNGNVLVSIFVQKGDNFAKITSPYGKIQHNILNEVMSLVQDMFVLSVHEDMRDSILLGKNFDIYYSLAVNQRYITSSPHIKNLVHYYLSALWQYDEQPDYFAAMIPHLIEKDLLFSFNLQSALVELTSFL